MPKYHELDGWDGGTNAPSHNFIYDFEVFNYWVRDDWRQVLSHSADGEVMSGSIEELEDAFKNGAEVKASVSGLCNGIADDGDAALDHELFIQVGSGYFYTGAKLFIGATHPFVRIRPAIPVRYTSSGGDYGWAMCRTDGKVAISMVDPYTLSFLHSEGAATPSAGLCARGWHHAPQQRLNLAPLPHGHGPFLPTPRFLASSRTAASVSVVVAERCRADIAPPGTTRPIGLAAPTATSSSHAYRSPKNCLIESQKKGRLFYALPTFMTRYFGHSP